MCSTRCSPAIYVLSPRPFHKIKLNITVQGKRPENLNQTRTNVVKSALKAIAPKTRFLRLTFWEIKKKKPLCRNLSPGSRVPLATCAKRTAISILLVFGLATRWLLRESSCHRQECTHACNWGLIWRRIVLSYWTMKSKINHNLRKMRLGTERWKSALCWKSLPKSNDLFWFFVFYDPRLRVY